MPLLKRIVGAIKFLENLFLAAARHAGAAIQHLDFHGDAAAEIAFGRSSLQA